MLTLGNKLFSRLTIIFGWCAFLWSYEVLQLLNRSYKQGPVLYYIFNTLLISLFVLHIYWWVLIFRMIVKQVEARGRISDDVRSGTPSAFVLIPMLQLYYCWCCHSCCFWKYDRNSGHSCCIFVIEILGRYSILVFTYHWVLMKSVGSPGS